MPWQTVDARPQKRRKGDAVEDAERRELRLRRTYNEAAAGHAALAAKAAAAPPADAVAGPTLLLEVVKRTSTRTTIEYC